MVKKVNTFQPLLAAEYDGKWPHRFPLMASPKYDGIRIVIVDGVPMTRKLKRPLPNDVMREALSGLPMLDGEIICGDPRAPGVFNKTQSGALSKSKPELEDDWTFFVFDVATPGSAGMPFRDRYNGMLKTVSALNLSYVKPIEHSWLINQDELTNYTEDAFREGFEGAMVRDPNGPYKWGRATARERILTKIKRFEDAEGEIVEVHEMQENQNEAIINPVGKQERRTLKDNYVGKGMLGGYTIRTRRTGDRFGMDKDEEIEFYLGASANMTEDELIELWKVRELLPGKMVKFSYQWTPNAEKPRFPVFLNFYKDDK